MSGPDDDAEPILAIVRAAGLRGFKASGAEGAPAAKVTDDAAPVLALVKAAGLPGFGAVS